MTDGDIGAAPRGGAGWDCGNGALPSRLTLLLLARANIHVDRETIMIVSDIAHDAGPGFCTMLIDRITQDEIPF